MKNRFLCLLSLVTVMLIYAPLARANEALHFATSSQDASSSVTEGNIWMATDSIAVKRSNATIKVTTKATTKATNEVTKLLKSLPMEIAPNPTASEPPLKPDNKLGAVVNKGVPSQSDLSFAEPPTSTKAPIAQSSSIAVMPPAQVVPVQSIQVMPPVQAASVQSIPAQVIPVQSSKPPAPRRPIELGFSLSPREPLYEPPQERPHVPVASSLDEDSVAGTMTDGLFTGNTNSLVARAVGSAEGTRTPEGDRTSAYYGHVDPGNRVWNRGSFSYQHSAQSPEDADQKQLSRLADQAKILEGKAAAYGFQLTLEEKLNGIDLANQAPKAALDQGGYIDWLAQARQRGMSGADAILWSRTRAFINPATQRWDAPGLGNNAETIGHDQARRMDAIARTIAANQNAVDRAVRVASAPAPAAIASAPAPAAIASAPTPTRSPAPTAVKSAQQTRAFQVRQQRIAQLLAEKIVELFGGDHIPADSTPVANEPIGVQNLFGFAL